MTPGIGIGGPRTTESVRGHKKALGVGNAPPGSCVGARPGVVYDTLWEADGDPSMDPTVQTWWYSLCAAAVVNPLLFVFLLRRVPCLQSDAAYRRQLTMLAIPMLVQCVAGRVPEPLPAAQDPMGHTAERHPRRPHLRLSRRAWMERDAHAGAAPPRQADLGKGRHPLGRCVGSLAVCVLCRRGGLELLQHRHRERMVRGAGGPSTASHSHARPPTQQHGTAY